ncbi:MAG TPA: AsmA-like C-terminal region-containing protein, partial [Hyphomicrobiaceae bacterium]|nr:AsmA-like C-terminal region-containing protein [Hyphomicrobiaceae bacterium]
VRLAHLALGAGAPWARRDLTTSDADGLVVRVASGARPSASGPNYLDDLELRAINIHDGTIVYSDQRNGTSEIVHGLDVALTGRSIAEPLDATGGLVWNGERITFTLRLNTLRQLIGTQAAKAEIDIRSAPVNATFDGTVRLGATAAVDGDATLTGHSFAGLMRWLGTELPNGKPLGHAGFTGRVKADHRAVQLSGARLELGRTRATGVASVLLKAKRPLVTADLRVTELDLDRLGAHTTGMRFAGREKLPAPPPRHALQAQSGLRPSLTRSPGRNPNTVPPQSIEDLLRRSTDAPPNVGRFSPQVRGYTATSGWSDTPLDAAILTVLDASLRLSIDGFKVAGLAIGRTVTRVGLVDGAGRVDFDDIAAYGGRGRGFATARASGRGIAIGLNVSADGIAAQPLLQDAASFDKIAGTAKMSAALSGVGRSQKDIMSSLDGKALFNFANGAVVGWDAGKIIRGLSKGQFSNFEAIPSEKTDFSELSSSFVVNKGVAKTSDFKLTSPVLLVTGAGQADIGGRHLDMVLRPKLAAGQVGQGTAGYIAGLDIPLRIKGSWDRPNISADAGGIKTEKVIERVKEIGRQFRGREGREKLRNLFRGDGDGKSVKNVLENLFKQ